MSEHIQLAQEFNKDQITNFLVNLPWLLPRAEPLLDAVSDDLGSKFGFGVLQKNRSKK